jgi:hypothetical protein
MSALEAFDRELSEHNDDGKNSWYDSGVVYMGKLAADLDAEDLVALRDLWPKRPPPWQRHCAEVLGQARRTETIALLLDMVDRGAPDVSLAALESLRDFDQALLTEEQRQHVLESIDAAQARPIGQLHHLVLGAFLARLRADQADDK